MKLSRHAFTRFWDVHAWAGVAAGLVLHVMVFAGAFALFLEDLSAWQDLAVPAGGARGQRGQPPAGQADHRGRWRRAAGDGGAVLGQPPGPGVGAADRRVVGLLRRVGADRAAVSGPGRQRGGWVGLLRATAAAFILIPMASALGTEAHLFNLGRHARAEVLGVELGLVLLGLGLLAIAAVVRRRRVTAGPPDGHLALGAPAPAGRDRG
jgi:hypothetical protein